MAQTRDMELVQSTAELMGLTSLMSVPVLLVAAGVVTFVLTGGAARVIECLSNLAAYRSCRPGPSADHDLLVAADPGGCRVGGSVAEPVRIAS